MISLAPGQKLVTQTAQAVFRLGLLVQDKSGGQFGLTARHILESEPDRRVYDAGTSALVGQRVAFARRSGPLRPFFETIGAFRIDERAASLNLSDPLSSGLMIADPEQIIGQQIAKVESQGRRIPGVAVGFGGSISLLVREGTSHIYRDVIEVAFRGSGDPLAPGEAGSLILDQNGSAVGLMIAGDKRACYVAPLRPFLDQHELQVIDALARVIPVDDDDAFAELSSDYRDALMGAKEMKAEMREEGLAADDPYNEPVPPEFLEMLEID